MFRTDLKRRMELIFGLSKTTFLASSESFEQDTLFIEIHSAKSRVSRAEDGIETARVNGAIVVFSQDDRLPFGFFTKRIERAELELKNNLFFYDVDTDVPNSPARLQDIHERRCNFVFLYDAQYDPSHGSLTSLELEE